MFLSRTQFCRLSLIQFLFATVEYPGVHCSSNDDIPGRENGRNEGPDLCVAQEGWMKRCY